MLLEAEAVRHMPWGKIFGVFFAFWVFALITLYIVVGALGGRATKQSHH